MSLGKFRGRSPVLKGRSGFSGTATQGESGFVPLSKDPRQELYSSPETPLDVPMVSIGTFSIDSVTASGTQQITGIPFKPRAFTFFMAKDTGGDNTASWGVDNGTTAMVTFTPNTGDTSGNFEFESGFSIYLVNSSTTSYTGVVSARNDDGFTITWTRTGAPTGTINIAYAAFR